MPDYFRKTVEDTLAELDANAEQGLTEAEVQRRQEKHGKNALPADAGTNWFKLIVGQFTELMVVILLVAAVISLFLGDVKDVVVIMVIVILNAALGIYQEYRAERAIAALSALQTPLVRVLRDGGIHQISAEELVPGDIVVLEEGDSVPADGRLIENVNLRIEEAALTGESQPVDKSTAALDATQDIALGDRNNMTFMGTAVTYGRGRMVVTQTGLKTELGNIAAMLMQVEQGITPLQRRLNRLSQTLAIAAGLLVLIIFATGVLIRDVPLNEMFLIAVSLAVAAVPEGLPALITISLSLGASRMVRRNALIRRLPAVETLGSVTVICSDKTGTLTRNEMTTTAIALPAVDHVRVTGVGYTPRGDFFHEDGSPLDPTQDAAIGRILKAMSVSTNAYLEDVDNGAAMGVVGDTTEGALLVAARKVGWTREQLEIDLPRVGELPFSSERKAMTTIHNVDGAVASELFGTSDFISITKGAPDRLIQWASCEHVPDGPHLLTEARRDEWVQEVDKMASQGLRVLGIAYRVWSEKPAEINDGIERELCLLGLIGILDPARPEAKEAVAVAREAGIRTIMITGDHALTAEAIARDLGILEEGKKAITGVQLNRMSEQEFSQAIQTTNCFARVSPEHKLRLVTALQEQKQIVAMTGDGVNDAPALKRADIGVAMGITGTDVSKNTAAMVLTDDNFASIVSAVEEGRTIVDNIRKFIKYLLSSNVGEILVMFTALLVGLKIPLLAIQILWINLVTDGLPGIALGFEPTEKGVMKRKPRPVDESIFAEGTGRHVIWVGILIAALTLGGYVYGFLAYDMQPFERTLGLEEFNRSELVALVGDEDVDIPENWDELAASAREDILLGEEDGEGFEEVGEGILGAAERIPRTIAFTVLAFTQMFEVMAIHAGTKVSFFRVWFKNNALLLGAVLSTFVLQLAVIYVPFMQDLFETSALSLTEMLIATVLGAVVLFAVELEKQIFDDGTNLARPETA
ncbi:MAG: cation-translocating P-type ATPase [Chloroflexi bacterium]|nr:cation-translocating P-type ATPase [Chloroflexota bacterium]